MNQVKIFHAVEEHSGRWGGKALFCQGCENMLCSNTMHWKKLGLVYCPNGTLEWAVSHAYVPTPYVLDEERIRVYAAFLDRDKVGRVGYVDVLASDPRQVLDVSPKPVLDIGQPGTFDDSGVTPLSLVPAEDGALYLYYIGWQRGVKVPYFLLVGLAVSRDNGQTFSRVSQVPILERSDAELFVRSASSVLKDGDTWKMWYIAGDTWIQVNGKSVPTYNIRYLESADGKQWGNTGWVCLDLANDDEYGFGRPFILKDEERYRMWYSIRTVSKLYRIGYAESEDGLNWRRMDDAVGIDVSPKGWDSEMICCASVCPVQDKTYLFYNGNNYGETGFGVAVLQQ